MTRAVLQPGERGGFGLAFEDLGAAPADVRALVVLRDEGRNASEPFPVHLVVEGRPGGPAPQPEPEPETKPEPAPPLPNATDIATYTEAGASVVEPGGAVEKTVRVANAGNATARFAVRIEGLPAGMNATSSPLTVELAGGASREIVLRFEAAPDLAEGSLTATVRLVPLDEGGPEGEVEVPIEIAAARTQEKPTPGAPIVATLVAAALLALAHRRRRD